ncbi:phenylalanine--tRNA ligase subunit alpha [bacterium]|nr:phenylalanine--tRNA ligase subunit alpha [bacterium]
MTKINLKTLKKEACKEIEETKNLKELDEIFKKYLGRKKGKLTQILRSLKDLPEKEKISLGKEANELKNFLLALFEKKATEIKEKTEKEVEKREWIDVTVPGKKPVLGHLHPLTIIRRKIEEIFQSMGFSVVEGPEIEDEWHNFDALNIPPDHPARDILSLGKTFYLKGGGIMRTHTSSVQVRYMKEHNPPFRIIAPGKVFRAEATDASHETNFYQVEGLMIGKTVSVANFKAIIQKFLEEFFKVPIKIRLRPSFFPFTEPSFEVDMECTVCKGKGCSACKHSGWIELMGAGMVHPNVLMAGGLNPKNWQGFAFGMSLDRLAMMKYKINDIRLFHSGDLRFLQQF